MSRPTKRRPTGSSVWRDRSLDDLAAEQKVRPVGRPADYSGAGSTLWRNDAELLRFLRDIRRRRAGRA